MDSTIAKSVQIKANLLIENLKYRPFPLREFQTNIRFIAISNITVFSTIEDIDTVCTISCNFVKSERVNGGLIETYELPLKTFLINQTERFQCYNFEPTWFLINSATDELIFTVKDFDDIEMRGANIRIQITINFR